MDRLIQFSPPVRFLKMTPPIGCLSEGTVAPVNQSINYQPFPSAELT
jgi:hypothetical protein